jgi:hypothetical protein
MPGTVNQSCHHTVASPDRRDVKRLALCTSHDVVGDRLGWREEAGPIGRPGHEHETLTLTADKDLAHGATDVFSA